MIEFFALKPLLPYLKKDWLIWECAQGTGMITRTLQKKGFKTIGSDLLTGQDFFKWQPTKFDCIITNPPSDTTSDIKLIRYKFLHKSYDLNKPFALLFSLTAFEECYNLLQKSIEVIFLPNKVIYEHSDKCFGTIWFTNGLGIGKNLTLIPENFWTIEEMENWMAIRQQRKKEL